MNSVIDRICGFDYLQRETVGSSRGRCLSNKQFIPVSQDCNILSY